MHDRETLRRGLERLIARHERRVVALTALSRRFSWVRLAIVVGGITVAWIAFRGLGEGGGWACIGLTTVLFAIVAQRHGRVEHAIRRARAWIALRATHLARMDHRWSDIPPGEMPPVDPSHPFERDLNITGERSILHLLDTSVSAGGRMRLRDWLLALRPDGDEIATRRTRIVELADLAHARDRLALAATLSGIGIGKRWKGDELLRWLEGQKEEGGLKRWLVILFVLATANLIAVSLVIADVAPTIWPATLVAYAAFYLHKRRDFSDLFQQAIYLEGALGGFAAVLEVLERFPLAQRPALRELLEPFLDPSRRPSSFLRKINRIAMATGTQQNGLLRLLLNVMLPWDYFFAYHLRNAREGVRRHLPLWLDRWYEMEALCSLATYAWLNPAATYPDIVDRTDDCPLFDGSEMKHPLIPYDRSVANSFAIQQKGDVAIVTGSNMSGKSTFLRTLGTVLVMTFAGGAVPATRLRSVLFRLFTCINVSDSVNDGISYFYAEVGRLKRLLAEVRTPDPHLVFFLVDEIFRGTNNRERLIGARSYVKALAAETSVGAISTHDLELIHLGEEMERVHNYHFREEVRDGRMVFDYRIRIGPSPTTNALAIMRAEGLPVDESTSVTQGA